MPPSLCFSSTLLSLSLFAAFWYFSIYIARLPLFSPFMSSFQPLSILLSLSQSFCLFLYFIHYILVLCVVNYARWCSEYQLLQISTRNHNRLMKALEQSWKLFVKLLELQDEIIASEREGEEMDFFSFFTIFRWLFSPYTRSFHFQIEIIFTLKMPYHLWRFVSSLFWWAIFCLHFSLYSRFSLHRHKLLDLHFIINISMTLYGYKLRQIYAIPTNTTHERNNEIPSAREQNKNDAHLFITRQEWHVFICVSSAAISSHSASLSSPLPPSFAIS